MLLIVDIKAFLPCKEKINSAGKITNHSVDNHKEMMRVFILIKFAEVVILHLYYSGKVVDKATEIL